MRNFIFLCMVLFAFFSCEKNDNEDILPNVPVDVTIDLNLPQYLDLNTPSGWVYTIGGNDGIQGIWIQNTGAGNPHYKAFERACPNNDCINPMLFDGGLKLKCQCDKSEYSIIDGAPQTAGNNYFAREYRVIVSASNPNIINITNY